MRLHLNRATRGRAVVGALVLVCATVPVADALQSSSSSHQPSGPPLDASLLQVPAPTTNAGTWNTERGVHTGPLAPASTTTPTAHQASDETVIHQTPAQRVKHTSVDTKYGIPRAALTAYKRASIVMAGTEPSCNLDWSVLAAIGQVESDQGRYGGSHVLSDGLVTPTIVGMPLDGRNGTARIPDTDAGRLDNDTVWDRAVGPMQFLPSTWAVVGVDGDGDGIRNPNDFDDAALAASVYLCAGHHDMSTRAGAEAAVYSYNHSHAYVSLVLALAAKFAQGEGIVLPNDTTPGTPSGGSGSSNQPGTPNRPAGHHRPGHKPTHKPGHKPSGGSGNPKPPPPPSGPGQPPKPPGPPGPHPGNAPTIVEGALLSCTTNPPADPTTSLWCVSVNGASTAVDLGDGADLTSVQGDYNGDGTAASVTDELTSMLGNDVRFQLDDSGVVDQINGIDYQVVQAPVTPAPTSPTPTGPTTTGPTTTGPTTTGPTTTGATTTGRSS